MRINYNCNNYNYNKLISIRFILVLFTLAKNPKNRITEHVSI